MCPDTTTGLAGTSVFLDRMLANPASPMEKTMNYEMILYLLVAFILGRLSKLKIYYGSDKVKYDKADYAILTKK